MLVLCRLWYGLYSQLSSGVNVRNTLLTFGEWYGIVWTMEAKARIAALSQLSGG